MNDNILLEDEIKCDYFVSKEQKAIWKKEVELLQIFMTVCNRNGLKYFVAHGTLLGAVRHKGFIPWDDDIDVNMPRADFEKLKKIAPMEFEEPYFFQTFESDPYYFSGIGKLRTAQGTGMDMQDIGNKCNNGLYIDIFPMDGIVEDDILRARQSRKVEFYRGLLLAKIYGSKFHYLLQYNEKTWKRNKLIAKFCSKIFLNKKFEKWCSKYTGEDCKREGIISFITDYECCYWYKKDYEELTSLQFEGISVPAPKNYQRCLSIKWDNYLEFPPVEKRGYKHDDVIMDAEIPYRKYDLRKFEIDLNRINKKIILFGGGKLGQEFIKNNGNECSIYKIIDNEENKWGTECNGIKICKPDYLSKKMCNEYCIVITSMAFRKIEEQLITLGIKDYKIYLPGRILKGKIK